jgi:hypothetical protein
MSQSIKATNKHPSLLSCVNSSLRGFSRKPDQPRALSGGAAGRRWQREGAGVVGRCSFRVFGDLPVVGSRAQDLMDRIWCILDGRCFLVELRWPEMVSSLISGISANKILSCCFMISRVLLQRFPPLAGHGGEGKRKSTATSMRSGVSRESSSSLASRRGARQSQMGSFTMLQR